MVGRGGGGMNWEIGIDIYTLICIKPSTRNSFDFFLCEDKSAYL